MICDVIIFPFKFVMSSLSLHSPHYSQVLFIMVGCLSAPPSLYVISWSFACSFPLLQVIQPRSFSGLVFFSDVSFFWSFWLYFRFCVI
jgi:hypothetical protein